MLLPWFKIILRSLEEFRKNTDRPIVLLDIFETVLKVQTAKTSFRKYIIKQKQKALRYY